MRSTPRLLTLALVAALVLPACSGAPPDDAAPATGGDVTGAVGDGPAGLIPEADRFGLETFRIVYALDGQETGTRTMWVEDHGARVGMEEEVTTYSQARHTLYYWDGRRSWMQELPDGEASSSPLRIRATEPSSFATTLAHDLRMIGYERVGEKTVAGRTCEHWRNDRLNFEGCRADHLELEFRNGAATGEVLQSQVAVELAEGEGIPDRILALAN